jgi:hypothetical protein
MGVTVTTKITAVLETILMADFPDETVGWADDAGYEID